MSDAIGKLLIPYKGQVSFYVQEGANVRKLDTHNQCTVEMTKLFAMMMAGRDVRSSIPKTLDVLACDGANEATMLTQKVMLTAITYDLDADGSYYASYQALLDNNYLSSTIAVDRIKFALCSSANDGHKILAYTYLADSNGDYVVDLKDVLPTGSNLLIRWIVKLINDGDN